MSTAEPGAPSDEEGMDDAPDEPRLPDFEAEPDPEKIREIEELKRRQRPKNDPPQLYNALGTGD